MGSALGSGWEITLIYVIYNVNTVINSTLVSYVNNFPCKLGFFIIVINVIYCYLRDVSYCYLHTRVPISGWDRKQQNPGSRLGIFFKF